MIEPPKIKKAKKSAEHFPRQYYTKARSYGSHNRDGTRTPRTAVFARNRPKKRRPVSVAQGRGRGRRFGRWGGRLLVQLHQLLQVVEAGLGGGFGLGEEVGGAVGEFAGE